MNLINRYSFFVMSAVILLLVGYLLFRRRVSLLRLVGFSAAGLLLLLLWIQVRPEPTKFQETADVEARIGAGKPVLLELQSPY